MTRNARSSVHGQLAPLGAGGLAVVGILGFGDRDGVGDEPEPAHALASLGRVVVERLGAPVAAAQHVAHGAGVAHRDREAWPTIGLL